MFTFTDCEWIENTFQKRECAKIIPSSKDPKKCCCGLSVSAHHDFAVRAPDGSLEHWNPAKHSIAFPTDAYGCIDFRGGSQTNKAQYIRLGYDTKADLVLNLLLREWGLEKPKLLISINGGKANFDLQPKLKRTLRNGLLKAAKTSGAWIFTGGTNNGVTKHIGDALISEKSPRIKGDRVVSIGIAPWGIIERRHELVGRKKDNPFQAVPHPSRSRFATLNKHHAYFLLVDNATVGKYGAEIALRRKLEKFISTQRLGNESRKVSDFSTPLVCLVIEGGTNTIRSVLEYVTDSPPVPVVVCDGTGRAADLLAFAHRYVDEPVLMDPQLSETFKNTIQKTFNVSPEQAERLHLELTQCVKRKNLITVFRCTGESGEETELDQVILTALFKSQQLSPNEQLSLALSWNRSDIAKKEIFAYGHDWPPGALDEAMKVALVNNRVNFVRLLLENGVNMYKFLTISRLEDLFNSKHGPANTLMYLVRDVVPKMSRGYRYTLIDIGNVINQLMGSGYRSNYTQRKFRLRYELLQQSIQAAKAEAAATSSPSGGHLATSMGGGGTSSAAAMGNSTDSTAASTIKNAQRTLKKSLTSTTLKVPQFLLTRNAGYTGTPQDDSQASLDAPFEHPFVELIIWAVLTKRQDMALLLWEHGEQALAKALLASRLYQAMALEAADDDLDVEIYDELVSYGNTFADLALGLLDFCYQRDDELTQHLLTASLQDFSRQTCLSLGDIAGHLRFLSHPLCQTILADLWMGGLRMRKTPVFKIVIGLLFPLSIVKLEFKTREELELMPQTEEEHEQDTDSNSSSSASSSSTSSRRSSLHGSLSSLELGKGGKSSQEEVDKRSETDGILLKELSRIDLFRRKTRPLKWKKKLYEFYAAPITKFYCHSIAYVVFLVFYTYLCLVKTPKEPSWPELYVMACMVSFGCENIRQIGAMEPPGISQKIIVWINDSRWNIFDFVTILIFIVAFILRMYDSQHFISSVHVVYSTDICYWYIRSLKLLSVNKYFGPFVMMMGKMIENMIYFVVLLLVVLMAFGVCRQAILHPNEEPDWILIRHIFFQPYFMLYGEVFAPDINPECNPDCENYGECGTSKVDGSLLVPCHAGRWITPIIMTIYLLVANILLINLLIALFNTIYNKVNAISHQLWNFQRFSVVMEYEEKPILPVPFIIFSHLFRISKYVYRRCKGDNTRFESGLKLFLSKYDMERLFDFEEECVEGFLREREASSSVSTGNRIKTVLDYVEEVKTKIEEFNRREVLNEEAMQLLDYRLQRIEDISEQTCSHLEVIHRFMAQQTRITDDENEDEEEVVDEMEDEGGLSDEDERGKFSIGPPSSILSTSQEERIEKPPQPTTQQQQQQQQQRIKRFTKIMTRSRKVTDSSEDDQFRQSSEVFLAEAAPCRKRSFNFNYARSQSESHHHLKVPPVPVTVTAAVSAAETGAGTADHLSLSRSQSNPDAGGPASENEIQIATSAVAWKQRLKTPRRRYATARDYTSITDDLESLFPPLEKKQESSSITDNSVPAVKIETECLRDAEESDYNLMETLIQRRLRRDSTNHDNSLEELVTRSIREESSSDMEQEEHEHAGDGGGGDNKSPSK